MVQIILFFLKFKKGQIYVDQAKLGRLKKRKGDRFIFEENGGHFPLATSRDAPHPEPDSEGK
ncbi:hypothetical protein [Pseudomonas sp. R1-15]|uniref:hypothetical protein n=1 Tax=Pseudomonas sp. R1-15 TaxID=2817399 RepID=UPI003DA7B063